MNKLYDEELINQYHKSQDESPYKCLEETRELSHIILTIGSIIAICIMGIMITIYVVKKPVWHGETHNNQKHFDSSKVRLLEEQANEKLRGKIQIGNQLVSTEMTVRGAWVEVEK